jgi:hypothetical protein
MLEDKIMEADLADVEIVMKNLYMDAGSSRQIFVIEDCS